MQLPATHQMTLLSRQILTCTVTKRRVHLLAMLRLLTLLVFRKNALWTDAKPRINVFLLTDVSANVLILRTLVSRMMDVSKLSNA